MVGVPGRSRACLTCKKRHIACDLQTPKCGQCTRSRRQCAFQQGHIFVHNDENSARTIYRKPPSPVSRETSTGSGQYASPESDDSLIKTANLSSSSSTSFSTSSSSPISTSSTLSRSRSRSKAPHDVAQLRIRPNGFGVFTAFQQQLLASAVADGQPDVKEHFVPRPWSFTLTSFASSIYSINSSSLACYAAWYGRQTNSPYLIDVSRRLYIQALGELQEAINNSVVAVKDETFGACLALIAYEAMECPDESNMAMNKHVEGCSRLLQVRGPRKHQHGPAHELFRAFRFVEAIQAIGNRRCTFISSSEWKTKPFELHQKTIFDRLVDMLAEGTDLVLRGDQLKKTPLDQIVSSTICLAEDTHAANDKLQGFYNELVAASEGPLYWDSERPSPLYTFDDVETGRLLTLYWAILAMVWAGLTDLHEGLQQLSFFNLPGTDVPRINRILAQTLHDWREPVRKVLKSAESCDFNEQSGGGPTRVAFPLSLVIGVMEDRSGCSTEYQKAVDLRQAISTRWLRILQFGHVDGKDA